MSKFSLSLKLTAFSIFIFFALLSTAAATFAQSAKSPSYALNIKKVVILPLADYSHQDSFDEALKWGGNRRAVEYIKNEFQARSIEVADQEKVVGLLMKMGAIKEMKDIDDFGTPEYELMRAPHWPQMTKELFKKIVRKQEKTTPISKQEIMQIGQALGVDTIVRGAILHYELEPRLVSNTFEDLIPFSMTSNDKSVPYYAIGPEYEKDIYDRFRITSAHNYKLLFPFNSKSSGIIVAIYLQDAATGDIVWKSSAEVPYPDPEFNTKLYKEISVSFKKLFRLNNYGYVNTMK